MTRIWSPYAFDPVGNALTLAAPPALRVMSGTVTPERVDAIQGTFLRFMEQSRLSAAPNAAQGGPLPGGGRYRITSVNGHATMQVWLEDVDDQEQSHCGIVLTTSVMEDGEPIQWLLTHSGKFADPSGAWAVRKPPHGRTFTQSTWYDEATGKYMGRFSDGVRTAADAAAPALGFLQMPTTAYLVDSPRYYQAGETRWLLAFFADLRDVKAVLWRLPDFDTGATRSLPLPGPDGERVIDMSPPTVTGKEYGGVWAACTSQTKPILSVSVMRRAGIPDGVQKAHRGVAKRGVLLVNTTMPLARMHRVEAGTSESLVRTHQLTLLTCDTMVHQPGVSGRRIPLEVTGVDGARRTFYDYDPGLYLDAYQYDMVGPALVYLFEPVPGSDPQSGMRLPLDYNFVSYHVSGPKNGRVERSGVEDTRHEVRYRRDGAPVVLRHGGDYSEVHQHTGHLDIKRFTELYTYTESGGRFIASGGLMESNGTGAVLESEHTDNQWTEYPRFGKVYARRNRIWQKSTGTSKTWHGQLWNASGLVGRWQDDAEYEGVSEFFARYEARRVHVYDPTLELLCYTEVTYELQGRDIRTFKSLFDPDAPSGFAETWDERTDNIFIPFKRPSKKVIVRAGSRRWEHVEPPRATVSGDPQQVWRDEMALYRPVLQFGEGFIPWDYSLGPAPAGSAHAFSLNLATASQAKHPGALLNDDTNREPIHKQESSPVFTGADFGVFGEVSPDPDGFSTSFNWNPRSGAGLLKLQGTQFKTYLLIDDSGIRDLNSALPDVPYDTIAYEDML